MNDKILFVDDEKNILSAYERNFRTKFNITTTASANEGLELIKLAEEKSEPFAVVVSDYRMPEMDGNQLLSKVKLLAPKTVRMMVTAYADINLAIEAVNEGNIFRFLTKPCPNDKLYNNLKAALEQYNLIVSEKELLDKTLKGAIRVLIDILAISNPHAFGRASRILKIAKRISENLPPEIKWQIEVAALLSQVGCVAVPTEILEKKCNGQTLNVKEKELYLSHPQVGQSLIRNIPRLEDIAEAISYQFKKYPTFANTASDDRFERISVIARILKHANDLNTLVEAKKSESQTIADLQTRYEDEIEAELKKELNQFDKDFTLKWLPLKALRPGMILAQDLIDKNGLALVAQGQDLSEALLLKLFGFSQLNRISEPIKVFVPKNEGE